MWSPNWSTLVEHQALESPYLVQVVKVWPPTVKGNWQDLPMYKNIYLHITSIYECLQDVYKSVRMWMVWHNFLVTKYCHKTLQTDTKSARRSSNNIKRVDSNIKYCLDSPVSVVQLTQATVEGVVVGAMELVLAVVPPSIRQTMWFNEISIDIYRLDDVLY